MSFSKLLILTASLLLPTQVYSGENTEALAAKCEKSKDCKVLGEAGYFEARGEPEKGMVAVMQTVINRRDSPSFQATIPKVVYAPSQFSFTKNRTRVMKDEAMRKKAFAVAYQLLTEGIDIPKEWQEITHFHAKNVKPAWTRRMIPVIEIGNHRFYSCNC